MELRSVVTRILACTRRRERNRNTTSFTLRFPVGFTNSPYYFLCSNSQIVRFEVREEGLTIGCVPSRPDAARWKTETGMVSGDQRPALRLIPGRADLCGPVADSGESQDYRERWGTTKRHHDYRRSLDLTQATTTAGNGESWGEE